MAANPIQLLDVTETAAVLRISTKTLTRRIRAGVIKPVILGPRLVRFPLDVVEEIARNGFPDAPVRVVRRGRPPKSLTTPSRLS